MNQLKVRFTSYALIFANSEKGEQILLTLLNRGPNSGKWTLPGGGIEKNETPEQALEREVYEETGLKLDRFNFLTRFDSEYRYPDSEPVRVIKNFYSKKIEHVLPVEVILKTDSTVDAKWFLLNDLTTDLIHPTVFQALGFFRKSFRKAVMKDAEAISRLVNSAYRGDSSRVGWTTEADILGGQRVDPEKIAEVIQSQNQFIELVAEKSDPSVIEGCVHVKLLEDETLFFGMLVVNPKLQNSGLGKILLSRVETLASEHHCKRVRMSVVHVRDELIQFYERRGYRATGRSEPFPSNDPRFGIPKVNGLVLLEFEKNLLTE